MSTLVQRVEHWLWRPGVEARPWWQRSVIHLARYAFGIGRDLANGQLSLHAMGLVYSTLLATVPLIAFSFSVLRGLNLHLELAPLLNEFLAPLGTQGATLTQNILSMVERVRGTVLGGLSLALFLYTAVTMVQKVETSFNFVWHVAQPRSLSRRIVDYAAVLLVAPLVMALAFTTLASLRNTAVVQAVADTAVLGPLTVQISKSLPLLMVIALFTSLYKWLPNAQVTWRAAALGGITAGSLWALVGLFFTEFVATSSRTLVIYASFAIAVLTLIWLYLNWLVLLLGARLAFYFQHRTYLQIGHDPPAPGNVTTERLALDIMRAAALSLRAAKPEVTARSLADQLDVAGIHLNAVIEQLERGGLLAVTGNERLLPARDIHQLRLAEVLNCVRAGAAGVLGEPRWSPATRDLAGRIDASVAGTLGELTLADWLDAAEG